MGENRKQVNAILRRCAERAEAANARRLSGPSMADPPFACPPDEDAEHLASAVADLNDELAGKQ